MRRPAYGVDMKFGWLHDGKNQQKWQWCRERAGAGRVVGLNWYSTDSVAPPRDPLQEALAANFRGAIGAAERILADARVIEAGRHFLEPVRGDRQLWTQRAISFLRDAGCDAVLLDPDTGISKGKASKEHVTADEVAAHAEAFEEVAVFQHTWQRVSLDQQKRELSAILTSALPATRQASFGAVGDRHLIVIA